MNVFLNDEETQADPGQTVANLLQQLSLDNTRKLAVAVNETVIRRSDWSEHALKENDRILLIAPIPGG
jgi:sulfur carrier protein